MIIEKLLHLSAAQAPKILLRKRRPNLGRLTVSPEMYSPRATGERSRQKSQLPVKVPAVLGIGKDRGCYILFPGEEDWLLLLPGDFFLILNACAFMQRRITLE
jgi:hypothetical protein